MGGEWGGMERGCADGYGLNGAGKEGVRMVEGMVP